MRSPIELPDSISEGIVQCCTGLQNFYYKRCAYAKLLPMQQSVRSMVASWGPQLSYLCLEFKSTDNELVHSIATHHKHLRHLNLKFSHGSYM